MIINKKFEFFLIFFYLILFSIFLGNTIHLENIDVDILSRLKNSLIPKGSINYDPQYNFLYLLNFLNTWTKLDPNFIIKIIWLFEKLTVILALYFISLLIFNIRIALMITLIILPFFRSGEVDQKTFCLGIQLFSIYFYFNKKFIISAILLSVVFYIHVGMGVWWYLPSVFSFIFLNLKKEKGFSINNFLIYNFITIFLIFPLLYFYFYLVQINENLIDSSFVDYWIGINNSFFYFIINKNYKEIFFILSNFIFFVFSLIILKEYFKISTNILLSLIYGFISIFIINEILVISTENPSLLKLQILRAYPILNYFSIIFLSFILIKQLNRGNAFFFIFFILLLIPSPIYIIFRYINFYETIYFLWFFTLFYEYFYKKSNRKEIRLINFKIIFKSFQINKIYSILAFFLLFFAIINKYFDLENRLLSFISQEKYFLVEKYSNQSLINYINKIEDKNIIFMIPFNYADLSYLINKKTLVSTNDVLDHIPVKGAFMVSFFKDEFAISKKEITNKIYMENLWKNLTVQDFILWKKKYGITHIIREKTNKLNFKKLFNDDKYIIYIIE